MTFNDYAVECTLYEYSNEYFNLMKECSEIELGERWINNQLVLNENAEDLGIEGDVTLTESFLMESADENSLQAMYEKTEEKKSGVWSKFLSWIKKGLAAVGKWFLHLAGIEHDDIVAQLKAQVERGDNLEAELVKVQKRLDNAGIHIGNQYKQIDRLRGEVADRDKKLKDKDDELSKKDRQLKGAHEAMDKVQKEKDELEKSNMSKNRKINDLKKSNAEKDAEIKRQQDANTNLGKEVTRWADVAKQYQGLLALAQKENAKLHVTVDSLPSACDPEVLCAVMVEFGELIKAGYNSNGMMIKANRVRQITKKLDDSIAEQRAGKLTINMASNTFKTCGERMNKLLEGLNAMQTSTQSSFDAEVVKLINEAMAKISKAQADTMKMVSPLIAARNTIYGLGKAHGKVAGKKEAKGA